MKKQFLSLFISCLLFCFSIAGASNNLTGTKPFISGITAKKNIDTRVYFSIDIPVLGIAKEDKAVTIKPEGGLVYLIVDNYPNNFTYDQVQVKVSKTSNGITQSYDNKTYNISTTNYFTYISYNFYSAGYYIFDVYNKFGSFIGSAGVTITVQYSSSSSSYANTGDCVSGYKEYYSPAMGFAMCIPQGSNTTESQAGTDKITVDNFYGHKLEISFMQDPPSGIDNFDANVVNLTRDMIKTIYSSYYRNEFKMLSSKGDLTIYRSVVTGMTPSGYTDQASVFYVRMNGKKIRGHDIMVIQGPFASTSNDANYQVIIELGMLAKLKIY